MVTITQKSSSSQSNLVSRVLVVVGSVTVLSLLFTFWSNPDADRLRLQAVGAPKPKVVSLVPVNEVPADPDSLSHRLAQCPYTSLSDLTPEELHPQQGSRHMVPPPQGGKVTLVCCQTTVGPWNILVHHKWAPKGAHQFVTMVNKGYFTPTVPLMRCLRKFLCQFGLTADPEVTKPYGHSFDDDPNWLPEGPDFRQNKDGVQRFAKGYLAYAGAGPNSRGNQFIVSLVGVGPLAGGSPWEVPWGELVGAHSFATLDKIYTGYGEQGPTQGKVSREGVTDELRAKFPKMDYVNACEVVDEAVQEEK